MYTQPHMYGQVAYAPPSYHQPGPSAYPYQQPPPPPAPVYFVDPNSFRRDYTTRLAELTINSRPIIQTLSMIAQEYSRWAEIVAQCLEAHIRRVPPWMKLPSFYLLDAMSKNVYDPYARHFAPIVIGLFLETYQQVDQATRSKMEEMLLTWRTASPTGKELFGVIPQLAIERGIWGGDSNSTGGTSGQISRAQVLSELEFTLSQKERALQANAWDTTAQRHVQILQQLRKLVEAGVSQDELRQILTQLRSLSSPAAAAAPTTATSYQYPAQASYPRQAAQSAFPPPVSQHPPSTTYTSYPVPSINQPKAEPVDPGFLLSSVKSTSAPSTDIAGLYSALLKAGIVTATGTPVGAGATATSEDTAASSTSSENLSRDAARAYRKSVLLQNIKLTNADITRKRPNVDHLLYDRLPIQCKQCGIRFTDDTLGKKEMEDHLDMHFRQNRKANQNIGRGHSRSWFVDLDDWVHEGRVDVKGKGRADGPRPTNNKAALAVDAARRDAELRTQFVVVPPGDEAKPISCPICKETLKTEFLEDDEEWVWKNAVKKDDKIYHATCHAEAMSSMHTLASRLRQDTASRSRSGTPDAPRATPPKGMRSIQSNSLSPDSKRATLKRKASDDDYSRSSVKMESGTPPMKKMALTA
ncbi:hypothetical protein DFH29DRAFT_885631 [Suillus ampliporus]|nr:hypothetical protein DFH29DRAFT_885631 [Suillus ampliporus]